MSNDNGRNLLGRITALALIIGVVYGVRAIVRGASGVGAERGSCCVLEEMPESPAAGAAAASAKMDADEDDAKIEAKAPVSPPQDAE